MYFLCFLQRFWSIMRICEIFGGWRQRRFHFGKPCETGIWLLQTFTFCPYLPWLLSETMGNWRINSDLKECAITLWDKGWELKDITNALTWFVPVAGYPQRAWFHEREIHIVVTSQAHFSYNKVYWSCQSDSKFHVSQNWNNVDVTPKYFYRFSLNSKGAVNQRV